MSKNGKELKVEREPRSVGRWVSVLHRYSGIYFDREMAHLDIGSGQLPYLAALYHEDGISQETLTRRMNMDKATTTRAVDRLVKHGYVRREVDSSDRRAYKVFLTPKGKRIRPRVRRILYSWTELLLTDFTENERDTALEFLKRMVDNASSIQDHGKGDP